MVSSCWSHRVQRTTRPSSLFLSGVGVKIASKSPLSHSQRACATRSSFCFYNGTARNGLLSSSSLSLSPVVRAERALTSVTASVTTAPLARDACRWSRGRRGESVDSLPASAPLHIRAQSAPTAAALALQQKCHFATLCIDCRAPGATKSRVETRCSRPVMAQTHVAYGFSSGGEGDVRGELRWKALRRPRGYQVRRCYSSPDFGGGQHFPSSDQVR